MKLDGKKSLAARTFNVGLARISFAPERVQEISEAITKQDIRDLLESGAISIKDIRGRRKIEKRTRRNAGKIKKNVGSRKQDYVKLTRKLRAFAKQLFLQGRINREQYLEVRKQIKSSSFRSKSHFKEIVSISQSKVKKIKREGKNKK